MVLHHRENRDHIRMSTNEAPIQFRESETEDWVNGQMEDLSATGLSLRVPQDLARPVGTVLIVQVEPSVTLTKPLAAWVEVVHHRTESAVCVMGCRVIEFL